MQFFQKPSKHVQGNQDSDMLNFEILVVESSDLVTILVLYSSHADGEKCNGEVDL